MTIRAEQLTKDDFYLPTLAALHALGDSGSIEEIDGRIIADLAFTDEGRQARLLADGRRQPLSRREREGGAQRRKGEGDRTSKSEPHGRHPHAVRLPGGAGPPNGSDRAYGFMP